MEPLFPSGIVATLGDRRVTVEDVRREIIPLLPRVQQVPGSPEELRQRLYALQNGVIADLITRQLNIKEFDNQQEGEQPKQIASAMIDNVIAEQVKNKFNNDQSGFLASLTEQGVTLEQYQKKVEEDIVYSYMSAQQRRAMPAKDGQAKPRGP